VGDVEERRMRSVERDVREDLESILGVFVLRLLQWWC
jgi:hypothetical protein